MKQVNNGCTREKTNNKNEYLSTWRDVSRGKPSLVKEFFCVACLVFAELVGRVKHIIYTRSGNNDDAMPPPILAKWIPRLSLCFLHLVRILQFHLKIAPFIFYPSIFSFLSLSISLSFIFYLVIFCVTHSIYLCDGVNSCCDVRAHSCFQLGLRHCTRSVRDS